MKRKILIAALLLASVGTFAQHEVGSLNIQPKIGLNIATMTNSDGSDPRVGFVVGAEAEYQATDLLSVTAGVLYSQQGIKADAFGIKSTFKMDYINVPILAKVSSGGTSAEMGIKEALRNAGVDASVKSFDLAIPVGLSYEYKNVQLDARYNWSVTKAISAAGENTRNSVFQITLGYKFAL